MKSCAEKLAMHEDISVLELEANELYSSMLTADNPVHINTKLNRLEAKLGKERLLSYPQYLTLPLTNVCNARCIFCGYTEKEHKVFVKPEDLKKLQWLRFVERINVNGGYGDSLANPFFGDIVDYIHKLSPSSSLSMTTNGIGLTEKIIPPILGHMSFILFSLNAPDPDSWGTVMQCRSAGRVFHRMVALLKDVCRNKPSRLKIGLSMVVFKDNLHLVEDFMHLSHEIGVDSVVLTQYYPISFYGNKNLSNDQSLYYCKEESDKAFLNAEKIAKRYGIVLNRPRIFSEEQSNCAGRCYQPFNQCILTNYESADSRNDVTPCCVGYRFGLDWDYSLLDDEYFMNKIWNNAVLRFFRRYQYNNNIDNAFCRTCCDRDRFDPLQTKHFLAAIDRMSLYSRALVEENPEIF
jgi:MoaA/NifB/PqqE/SkfB family radical SAM enzyme